MLLIKLRIYDPRINRWISPDPYKQFHSPYLAMDNRWNMLVDPDGGCTVGVDCPKEFDHLEKGTIVLDEIVLNVSTGEVSGGIPYETSGLDFKAIEKMQESLNLGTIRADIPDWTDKWRDSNFFGNLSCNFSNDFYVTAQTLNPLVDKVKQAVSLSRINLFLISYL